MTDASPATSFTLEEAGGITLTLRDRALPYRPISINGRQRAEFTWYPGSPQATVQMLGPEEGVISLRGFWKDRFIGSAGSNMVQFTGGANPPTGTIDVATLVARVDQMRREGRRVKLTWDTLIRYGHITSFTQTWHNQHDCEWEMEFSVLSQEEPSASTTLVPPSSTDAATTASEETSRIGEETRRPPETPPPPAVTSLVTTTASTAPTAPGFWDSLAAGWQGILSGAQGVRDWATSIETTANLYASQVATVAQQALYLVQTPGDVGRSMLGVVTGPATILMNAGGALFDGALTEYFVFAEPFGYAPGFGAISQDNVPFGLQIAEKSYVTRVKRAWVTMRNSNALLRAQYTAELQGTTERVFVADRDMDLRDVCTRFYGSQDQWAQLMLYNGLLTSSIPAGYVVRVPQRLDGSPAGRS